MDGYLSKPIRPAELRQAIADFFPLRGPKANGKSHAPTPGAAANDFGPVLDRSAVRERVSNAAVRQRVAVLFHEDCPNLLTGVRQALAQNDAGETARTAHTLKGMLGNLGATAARQAAAALERVGRPGDPGGGGRPLSRGISSMGPGRLRLIPVK